MIQFKNIFHKPFTGNTEVRRMIELNGGLYVAVGGDTPKILRIYRLDHAGCKIWQNITPNWKPSPGTYDLAMAGFNGELFIGTDGGQIYRIDAKVWPKPPPVQLTGSISNMTVFKKELYASASHLHHTSNGTQWKDLGLIKSLGPNEFLDGMTTLQVFDGYLYAGFGIKKYDSAKTWKEIEHGIEIWRSLDGKDWKLFKSITRDLKDPYSDPAPQHVHAMKVYGNKNKHLYIGEYEGKGGIIFRTDGSLGSWEEYQALPNGTIRALEEHDGKLYAGQYRGVGGSTAGDPLLYFTANGTKWSVVPGSPVGDPKTCGIISMASVGGRLYFGTHDLGNGGEVYEMGDPISPCQIADFLLLTQKTVWNALDWMIRDLKDAKLVVPKSSKEMLEDLESALMGLCVAPTMSPVKEMALDYLRLVQRELDLTIYFAEVVATIEDPTDRTPALDCAIDHAERALSGYRLFIATLSDVCPR